MHHLLEIAALAAQPLVVPALAILYMQLRSLQSSNEKVLNWLERNCPHCGAVRVFTRE